MKTLLNRQVPVVWLLVVMILLAAVGITWWVMMIDAAPSGAILIKSASQVSSSPITQAAPVPSPTEIPGSFRAATPATATTPEQRESITATPQMVGAYISGAVARPGLYMLPAGSRVQDLVLAAGGASSDADMEQVNVAARVADEEHITIPRKGEAQATAPVTPQLKLRATPTRVKSQATVTATKASATAKVNINSASAQEMEALPGLGPVISARIVAYREANGPFTTVDDLEKVSGIGKATLAKLRDLVTVGP